MRVSMQVTLALLVCFVLGWAYRLGVWSGGRRIAASDQAVEGGYKRQIASLQETIHKQDETAKYASTVIDAAIKRIDEDKQAYLQLQKKRDPVTVMIAGWGSFYVDTQGYLHYKNNKTDRVVDRARVAHGNPTVTPSVRIN